MAIHWVYAIPPAPRIVGKIRRRAILSAQRLGWAMSLVGPRDGVETLRWPSRAPISITQNVYQTLRPRSKTLLYDWAERVLADGGPGDILIGHPFPGDERTVWNRSCREGEFAVRIAMLPLSHQMAEICGRMDPYIPLVDAVFGIMGPYWYDTWQESALAHWKEKIIPLDMAIDVMFYPRVKRRFNPPGKRKFFYIGWNGAQKGTHLLSILFGLARQHQCIWIGNGLDIPNVEHRPAATFSEDYLAKLAGECDVFITLGVSDANPATILESMAWGFPVCCTPQSGYYNIPELIPMSITDMNHNLAMLDWLQGATEDELMARAGAARLLVETRFTWPRFTQGVIDGVERTAHKKGIDPWESRNC